MTVLDAHALLHPVLVPVTSDALAGSENENESPLVGVINTFVENLGSFDTEESNDHKDALVEVVRSAVNAYQVCHPRLRHCFSLARAAHQAGDSAKLLAARDRLHGVAGDLHDIANQASMLSLLMGELLIWKPRSVERKVESSVESSVESKGDVLESDIERVKSEREEKAENASTVLYDTDESATAPPARAASPAPPARAASPAPPARAASPAPPAYVRTEIPEFVNRWSSEVEEKLLESFLAEKVSEAVVRDYTKKPGDLKSLGTLSNPHMYLKTGSKMRRSTLGLAPYGVESAEVYKGDYVQSFQPRIVIENGQAINVLHMSTPVKRTKGNERPEE